MQGSHTFFYRHTNTKLIWAGLIWYRDTNKVYCTMWARPTEAWASWAGQAVLNQGGKHAKNVQLNTAPDEIRWRWTADGMYTSKLAYRIQSQGSFCSFNAKALWSANAEGKHKFFGWLLLQRKILTADKLLIRNWPCNPVCIFCDQELETAVHLCFTASTQGGLDPGFKLVWWLGSCT
jgi:hypothetical protein